MTRRQLSFLTTTFEEAEASGVRFVIVGTAGVSANTGICIAKNSGAILPGGFRILPVTDADGYKALSRIHLRQREREE